MRPSVKCLMDSTLSNGVPFKIIGEVGVVGVLFADITMYLHLKLSGRTALNIMQLHHSRAHSCHFGWRYPDIHKVICIHENS